jgi:hypothetical protein
MFQSNPYSLPLLLAALIPAGLALYSWHRRYVPGALAFGIRAGSIGLWTVEYRIRFRLMSPSRKERN